MPYIPIAAIFGIGNLIAYYYIDKVYIIFIKFSILFSEDVLKEHPF